MKRRFIIFLICITVLLFSGCDIFTNTKQTTKESQTNTQSEDNIDENDNEPEKEPEKEPEIKKAKFSDYKYTSGYGSGEYITEISLRCTMKFVLIVNNEEYEAVGGGDNWYKRVTIKLKRQYTKGFTPSYRVKAIAEDGTEFNR